MNNRRAIALIGLIGVALAGCREDEPSAGISETDRAVTDGSVTGPGNEPNVDHTPCEILDDELIRAHFDIAAGIELTRSPSKHSPHPLCTVSWLKANAAEIERRSAAAMAEYMQKKVQGESVKMPAFRTTDEVSLAIHEPAFESPEKAMAHFESAMKRLQEGTTRTHEDIEVTYQADLSPVEGIGDKAMWAAKMHQLSVVQGIRIFHVTVNTGVEPEDDLQTAKEIALAVSERL